MTPVSRRRAVAFSAALLLCSGLPPARGQAYPDRPLRLIVPFPAGGSTDAAGRIWAEAVSPALGQPVRVANRPGAAGSLGTDEVAKAPADGYTLGVAGVGPLVTLELMGGRMPYVASRDLVPVAHLGSLGLVIAVRSDLNVRTLGELLAFARAHPGRLSFGTSGAGSPGHLAFEYLKSLTDTFMVHIPYRGDSPLVTDLTGEGIDIAVLTLAAALPHAGNASVRLLAVTSRQRSQRLPQLPTVAESGVAGYEAEIWNILVAPAGTPDTVVQRLNGVTNAALAEPGVRQQLASRGLVATVLPLKEVARFVQREREKWTVVLKRIAAGTR